MGALLSLLLFVLASEPEEDTCLLFAARNLAEGAGNFYLYQVISELDVEIRAGDRLCYEIFLPEDAASPRGGIDIELSTGNLRDSGATDASGRRAHGDAQLLDAVGRWAERRIDLSALAGRKTKTFDIQAEADEPGPHVQFLDDVRIEHAGGTRTTIYAGGEPAASRVHFLHGYSERVVLRPVLRSRVVPGGAAALVDEAGRRQQIFWQYEQLEQDVRLSEAFLAADGRDDLLEETRALLEQVPAPAGFAGSPAEYAGLIHERLHALDHAHAAMLSYTGHLVGHAHIDFQWLWEWPEGIEVTRQTFAQACRFMDEFDGFTFTQSSAALYLAIEEHYPDLFAEVQRRVAAGTFEIVGGRWCEGDTNIISAESHARHFLHAQRYFRSRFGRIATVGWEPDTFGHVWTLPQMLKLAGIESYYFSRAGAGFPLFWWQGPDGSRVLAFDEPASGSWYNSTIDAAKIQELLDFRRSTGLRDLMWVYGVGNHGGGPTAEQIEKALGWQRATGKPTVRFATAEGFFAKVREQDLTGLPKVRTELNCVFPGCYTTHGDIKRLNRDAEAALVQAETLALLAAGSGFPVPRAALARAWQDVLWNHHHDTLPGTSIHESYDYSRLTLERAVEQARWTAAAAMRHLAHRVEDQGDGFGVLVVNTLGWARDGVVGIELEEGEAGGDRKVVGPDGAEATGQIVAGADGRKTLEFLATGVPAFGHDVWRVVPGKPRDGGVTVTEHTTDIVLENGFVEAVIDRETGELIRLTDLKAGREVIRGGRRGNVLEAHMETLVGMSAWIIGEIGEVRGCDTLAAATVLESGPLEAVVEVQKRFNRSTIAQRIRLAAGGPRLDFFTTIDWRERGETGEPAPLLKVAFPLGEGPFEARYSLPFGDIARSGDGAEVPALCWAALTSAKGGAALLNDCKHGHSATPDGVLRLSLLRASCHPDPLPDCGVHRLTYSVFPLPAGALPVVPTRAGFELNTPLVGERLLHNRVNAFAGDRQGLVLPARRSLATLERLDGAVPTCFKRAEDGSASVLRLYEANGAPASGRIALGLAAANAQPVNLIEDAMEEPLPLEDGGIPVSLRPYQILSLRIE